MDSFRRSHTGRRGARPISPPPVSEPFEPGDASSSRPGAVLVAGVPVDDVTMDEALDLIMELVADGRARDTCHQVATVNVDFVVNALDDDAVMEILRRSSLSVPDGMPVVWASRMVGGRLRERVAGADLVPALVERAARDGRTVVLYGAGPGIARQAADLLRARVPTARVVGDAGPDDAETVRRVEDLGATINARPDICCVAFGNPKQERFIARFADDLRIPVMIGVGGSLDFLVGAKRRAPGWTHRIGLEWVHRALTEPRRLVRRYARDVCVFVPAVASQAWRGRSRASGGVHVRVAPGGDVSIEVPPGAVIDNRTAARIVAAVRSARRIGAAVDVSGADRAAMSSVAGLSEVLEGMRD